jgi:myosin heavy subunit
LEVLGFSGDEVKSVFKLIAGVLWLGQIRLLEATADSCMVDGMTGRVTRFFLEEFNLLSEDLVHFKENWQNSIV